MRYWPGQRSAEHVHFGTVAAGEVVRHQAARDRAVVIVHALFACRLRHPQIDVGLIGVPRQRDPHVDVEQFPQSAVERRFVAVVPNERRHLRQQAIGFGDRDELDVREPLIPVAEDDIVEDRHRPPIVVEHRGIGVVGFANMIRAIAERQREIAVRLRLFRAGGAHFLEEIDREIVLAELLQPMGDDAGQTRVRQFEFADVGEHAQT